MEEDDGIFRTEGEDEGERVRVDGVRNAIDQQVMRQSMRGQATLRSTL
jgi:hypothetical protein